MCVCARASVCFHVRVYACVCARVRVRHVRSIKCKHNKNGINSFSFTYSLRATIVKERSKKEVGIQYA